MPEVLMYTTAACPYCVAAKAFLARKGVKVNEIRVDLEPARRAEMMERSQRRTVPQIFIGDHHVGGHDDMMALERAGGLQPLLDGS